MARFLGIFLVAFEILMVILYASTTNYESSADVGGTAFPDISVGGNTIAATDVQKAAFGSEAINEDINVRKYYGLFADVHVMIFIGFGFLMTFLAKYGYSAVSFNFLLGAISIQWGILTVSFWHMWIEDNFHEIKLDITSLIGGDFAAGAVLISMGAVLGKASPTQLVLMAVFELIFYGLNEAIGLAEYGAIDVGGSMFVHTFGAYFGLAVARVLDRDSDVEACGVNNETTNRASNLFSMIGTIFLWIYWPSFNGALAGGLAGAQSRVVINTVLSLSASCIGAFAASQIFRGEFAMEDIQNATLAGGVAVGSSADLLILPYAAVLIGLLAGIISTAGYKYNFLSCLHLHDTCGVHNLHGIPGIMGGISGAISAASASTSNYGTDISVIYPERGAGRSASEQAGYQLAALGTTLLFSIIGGTITGYLIKKVPREQEYFHDKFYFEGFEQTTRDTEAAMVNLGQSSSVNKRF